jgi:DNA-binding MarR family transcriptional regulator
MIEESSARDGHAGSGDEEPDVEFRPTALQGSDINHALVRVARLHHLLAAQLLRRFGLHPSQELVLIRLWEAGAQKQVDLAAMLGADSATMTRTIQRLENGGFVRRVPSTTDRRVTMVEPTTASYAIRTGVEQTWAALEEGTVGGLNARQCRDALALLAQMETSLDAALESTRAEA